MLATLGYAPGRRSGRASAFLRVAGVMIAVAAIWGGWRVYYAPGSEADPRRPTPRTSHHEVGYRHTCAATPRGEASGGRHDRCSEPGFRPSNAESV